MKHILPILTLALLGTAVTAFAEDEAPLTVATSPSNYYHDYYLDPPNTNPVRNNDSNGHYNYSDTFTYGTRDNNGNAIANPDVFTVVRETNMDSFLNASANTTFYRVDFANYEGKKSTENNSYTVEKTPNEGKVTLYLTDFVSEVVPQAAQESPYNASTNSLISKGIVEYGYRVLTTTDGKTYSAGETIKNSIYQIDKDGNFVLDEKGNKILSSSVTPIDYVDYDATGNPEDYMTRYKYELGTFSGKDIIELYMKDSNGNEVYSFSSLKGVDENGENVFTPFDKTDLAENGTANGGFGDGGYRVNALQTDAMLNNYYFVKDLENGLTNVLDYEEDSLKKFDSEKVVLAAAQKAMPLSRLITVSYISGSVVEGNRVAFGFYGVAVGSPLPGGLQIALIAGLFGLGFCYVRRRKAIAG